MKILLATGNANKKIEFKRILEPLGVEIVDLKDVNITDFNPVENGITFAQNARIKALEGYKLTKMPTIADDSGLMVAALHGEPGVFSARYAGEGATDDDRINLVLENMIKSGTEDRTAAFVSAICFVVDEKTEITSEGICKGAISEKKMGDNGFGYDPVFIPEGYSKSFAELSGKEKDKISHRGRALDAFYNKLSVYLREKK